MKKYKIYSEDFMPRNTTELLRFAVRPYKFKYLAFFGLTFLGVFCWNASSYVASLLINNLSETSSVGSKAWQLVAVFAFFRFFDEIFWRIGEIVMRNIKPQTVERVRASLFAKVSMHEHSFFVNSSSGKIAHWVNQLAVSTDMIINNTVWGAWGELLGLVLSAGFLLTVHWSLALLFSVWLILLFWYNSYRGKQFEKLISLESEEKTIASGLIVDAVANSQNMRVFNARRSEQQNLMKQQDVIVGAWRRSWRFSIFTNVVKGQSTAVVNIFALCLAVIMFSRGIIPIGGLVLFIAYFNSASSALWNLAWNFDEYYRQFGTVQNAIDGLKGIDERKVEESSRIKIPNKVRLELKNISFAYPEQPKVHVLKKLHLKIESGQKVGIVGHSGAGKSTLIGLILGFYEPIEGEIVVNNENTLMHDPSYIRALSAYVPQDTTMFNRSVRENVAYSRPNATEAEVIESLKLAEALEFVENLENGLDTIVGERGVKLSGGQRQRIAIARAILKDAPLLLLDEATSALDSVSEQAIQKALHELMKGRTAIVIAHRLSTLKHLDKIVVVEKGEIAEQGTHDELLKIKNGVYADLWKRQKDGFIVE